MYLSLKFLDTGMEGNKIVIHNVYKIEANQLFREAFEWYPVEISVKSVMNRNICNLSTLFLNSDQGKFYKIGS